jgi:hypothetical protein
VYSPQWSPEVAVPFQGLVLKAPSDRSIIDSRVSRRLPEEGRLQGVDYGLWTR